MENSPNMLPQTEAPALARQNITIMLDQKQDDVLKPLYCICCGNIVLEYYGGVKLIMPGYVEVDWLDIVGRPYKVQCKNRYHKTYISGKEVRGKCRAVYHVIG